MADTEPAQPAAPSTAGPSRSSSRHDMEGLGKFKVRQYQRSSAPPPKGSSSYKAKFFVLKETYDAVTARREELRRELELANSKLKAVESENDLLLDAMFIVTPSQPSLVGILQQMDPEPPSTSVSLGGASGPDIYPLPRHAPAPHSHPSFPPPNLPEHEQRPGPIIDAAALNGNGNGHGYTHHAPVHTTNGRTRSARNEFREPPPPPSVDEDREPADQDLEMLDDDGLLAERELQREHQREQD